MHTQDAMSEAVEGAELILYGVSAKSKRGTRAHSLAGIWTFACGYRADVAGWLCAVQTAVLN